MSKIAFRVDGGKDIGLGHVMRSLVLAKELGIHNEIVFICRNNSNSKYEAGINIINNNGFRVIKINEDDIIKQLKRISNSENIDCLITDSYDVKECYFDEIKKIFKFTGYIDDTNICRLNVDFIINQNIYASNFKYNTYPNNSTKLFLGTQYCLLREEFRQERHRIVKRNVKDILVTLGGMDHDYNTLKIVELLKDSHINYHIVVGAAFEEELVNKLKNVSKINNNIILYRNANMAKLMEKCDMAIAACGSTTYELSAMQLPTVGIVIADNQQGISDMLGSKGVIIATEDLIYRDKVKFYGYVNDLINDEQKRISMIGKQKQVVNRNGVKKLANEICKIINN